MGEVEGGDGPYNSPAMAAASLQPQAVPAAAAAGGDGESVTSQPQVSRSSVRTHTASPSIFTTREEEVDTCRGRQVAGGEMKKKAAFVKQHKSDT